MRYPSYIKVGGHLYKRAASIDPALLQRMAEEWLSSPEVVHMIQTLLPSIKQRYPKEAEQVLAERLADKFSVYLGDSAQASVAWLQLAQSFLVENGEA